MWKVQWLDTAERLGDLPEGRAEGGRGVGSKSACGMS